MTTDNIFVKLVQLACLLPLLLCPVVALTVQHFDIHELSSDHVTADHHNSSSPVLLTASLYESVRYWLSGTPIKLNRTEQLHIRLHLNKPYRLRQAEFDEVIDEVVLNESYTSPYVEFIRVNSIHRGNYTLYRFDYDHNEQLVQYSRIELQLMVEGLLPEGQSCFNDGECESGHCLFKRCACTSQFPVYYNSNCHQAKNFNESCQFDEECQETGGPKAECFSHWQRCRCKKGTVPVKISSTLRHCVTLAPLNSSCLYSKQCSLSGENRYCNSNYLCDCLPGFRLINGRTCNMAHQVSLTNWPVKLALSIVSFLWTLSVQKCMLLLNH